MFKKLKQRLKQIKYYTTAKFFAGSLFGGLTIGGIVLGIVNYQGSVIRCVVGDVGEGNEVEARVAQSMKDHSCQDILHLGDNVYDTGLKNGDDKKFLSNFWNYFKGFRTNIMTQGNHDAYNSVDGLEAWITLSGRHPNLIYPAHYFLYRSNDWCVFSWFSEAVERDDNNKFVLDQADFAAGLDLTGCKVKVSMSHHPYRSQGEHSDCVDKVCDFYEKYIIGKFDYSLAGHDHQLSYEGQYEGTEFYVSGAGSQLRTCKKGKNKTCFEKFGFLKFVNNDKPQFIFVK